MYSWSNTGSSNQPDSGDSSTVQADLQAIQAGVRGWLAHKGSDIASSSSTPLADTEGLFHDITGTTTINSFGTTSAGIWKVLKFEGAAQLTHSASLILPGAETITTADGDMLKATSEGSGVWRVNWYQRGGYIPTGITLAAEQASTSGTAITFSSIPPWVKKITLMLVGVSTNGTAELLVQIGDSGGLETTGYVSTVGNIVGPTIMTSTSGFIITSDIQSNAFVAHGAVQLFLQDIDGTSHTWVCSSNISAESASADIHVQGGSKTLSVGVPLDRVVLTTTGADTFDAGAVSIQYE